MPRVSLTRARGAESRSSAIPTTVSDSSWVCPRRTLQSRLDLRPGGHTHGGTIVAPTRPSPSLDTLPMILSTHEQVFTTTGARSCLIMSVALSHPPQPSALGVAAMGFVASRWRVKPAERGIASNPLLADLPLIIAFVVLAAHTDTAGLGAPATSAVMKDLFIYVEIIVAIKPMPLRPRRPRYRRSHHWS